MIRTFITLILCLPLAVQAQHTGRTYGDLGNGYFLNPVLAGDYPDPTILRDGNDYYMTHTSHNNYPALLIWHSTDLVNWEPVTHALHKYVGEIWAPDLVKHKEKYYIYFPARDFQSTMVVTADRIEGPWTDPVELKISHIDPGHVVDEKGNRYLFFSDGHMIRLSDDGLSTIGNVRRVYDGWPYPEEWLTECFCLESPKLIKRGNYFYLLSAQGGTSGPATSHMAVLARSKSLLGPWENSPYNPVVHTYSSQEKWWSKGHASLVEGPGGDWWMVYHSCLNNFRTLGRMTLLEPIEWTPDGWFRVRLDSDPAKPIRMPLLPAATAASVPERKSGFSSFEWQFYNAQDPERFILSPEKMIIRGTGADAAQSGPALFTPGHQAYITEICVTPDQDSGAGFMLFYSPMWYRGLEVKADSIRIISDKGIRHVAVRPVDTPVFLRIINDNQTLALAYRLDGLTWQNAGDATDVSPFQTNLLGGFRSLKVAAFNYGKGSAEFEHFRYAPMINPIK